MQPHLRFALQLAQRFGMPLEQLGRVMTAAEFGDHLALEVMRTTPKQQDNQTDPELQALFDSD